MRLLARVWRRLLSGQRALSAFHFMGFGYCVRFLLMAKNDSTGMKRPRHLKLVARYGRWIGPGISDNTRRPAGLFAASKGL